MKSALAFITFLFLCLPVFSKGSDLTIILENSTDIKRADESFMITRSALLNKCKKINTAYLPVLKNAKGEYIPSQCDDLDKDGSWDELAFVCNLAPKEKIILSVYFVKADQVPVFLKRSHARLGYSESRNNTFVTVYDHTRPADHKPQSYPMLYQFEGVGWENDKVAFRQYFDARNGKDIFGKRISKMVLDEIGLPGRDYHELQEWGMDVLKVGTSLGAGSLAMIRKDSLYRLADTKSARYQLIADGPVRSIVRLSFGGWDVDGKLYDLQEDISIWAGKYCYEGKISMKSDSVILLAAGIVNLKNETKEKIRQKAGTINILATYAPQSENHDLLGMAILAHDNSFAGYGKAPEQGQGNAVTNTDYVRLRISSARPAEYVFFAGWELSQDNFKNQEDFLNLLRAEALKRSKPVKIEFGK